MIYLDLFLYMEAVDPKEFPTKFRSQEGSVDVGLRMSCHGCRVGRALGSRIHACFSIAAG